MLARAQEARRIDLTAGAIVGSARSRSFFADTAEIVGGLWLGGAVGATAGRVSVSLTGLRGTLSPIANTPFPRDEGQVELRVRFDPRRWVGVQAAYTVRASNAADLYQRWNVLGAGVRFSGPVADSAVRAYVGVSYSPFVSATVQASAEHGLGAEAGVSANLDRWTIELNYHFERYDFAGGAAARLEEFDSIELRVARRFRWPGMKADP